MGTLVSLFLIALGAILTWAVTASTNGLNIHVVGVVLMLVGLVGFLLDMLFWASWGPRLATNRTTTVVDDGYAPAPAAYDSAPAAYPAEAAVVERRRVFRRPVRRSTVVERRSTGGYF